MSIAIIIQTHQEIYGSLKDILKEPVTNTGNPDNVTADNWSSRKYKSSILGKPAAGNNNGVLKNATIAVPLKYLSNFWQSLEIPLINCKILLELSWTKNFAVSSVAKNKEFTITNAKLYVPIVTLLTDDNVKLTKQLSEGFKRSVYWNQYKTGTKTTNAGNSNPKRMLLFDVSFQGDKRFFVIAFGNTENGAKGLKKKQSPKIFSS